MMLKLLFFALIYGIGSWIYKVFFKKYPDYFVDEFGQKYRINETGGKVNVEE